ncbi:MAG: class I SAM-dependent methyltransferase [Pseudomonadota bacterium]
MNSLFDPKISAALQRLHAGARDDLPNIAKGFFWSIGRKIEPRDFANAYIAISAEQGRLLYGLARAAKSINIVEFGASFGISTLYLAAAARDNGGYLITTEIEANKCEAIRRLLKETVLQDTVTLLEGDAEKTLVTTSGDVDFLFLDAWSQHYVPIIQTLEPRFLPGTPIVRDNAGRGNAHGYVDYIAERPTLYTRTMLKTDKGATELVTYLGTEEEPSEEGETATG